MKEIFFNSVSYPALRYDGLVYSCATSGGDSIHFDGNDYLICGPLAAPVVACPANAALATATGASYTVANTGGAAASWAITSPSPVPAGISLANQAANSVDVVFSNTVADGTYSITVEATNATGSDDCTFEVMVGDQTCTGPIIAACVNVGTAAEPNINCGVGPPHSNTTTETICGYQIIAFNSGEGGGPGNRSSKVTLQSATPLNQSSVTSFNGVATSGATFSSSGNEYTWRWLGDVWGMGGGSLDGQPFTICYECPAGGGATTNCSGSISCNGDTALSGNPSSNWYGTGSVPGSVPADALGDCSGDISGVSIDSAIQQGASIIILTVTGTIPSSWDSLVYAGAIFPPPQLVGTIDLSSYGTLTGQVNIPISDTDKTAAEWITILGGSHDITATCS